MLEVELTDVAPRAIHARQRMSPVARGCVPGPVQAVVRGSGEVSSTTHERERTEADGGCLRRRGHGRRPVAAGDETNQALEPGHATEAGGRVAQAMPEAGARTQEERADGRRAE